MSDYQQFSDCPNCGAESTFMTFRNIYQCHDCGKHYCDHCALSNYRCPHCYSSNFEKIGEAH